MNISRFSPYKCIRNQIWHFYKVGQGQPRFIICANWIGPTSAMLHLGHVTRAIGINFGKPIIRSLQIKFEFNWPSGFWGNFVLMCWWDSKMSDLGWKVKGQPWPLKLIYSHCLIRLNISSENNLASTVFKKSTFLKKSHLNALGSKFDLDVK